MSASRTLLNKLRPRRKAGLVSLARAIWPVSRSQRMAGKAPTIHQRVMYAEKAMQDRMAFTQGVPDIA